MPQCLWSSRMHVGGGDLELNDGVRCLLQVCTFLLQVSAVSWPLRTDTNWHVLLSAPSQSLCVLLIHCVLHHSIPAGCYRACPGS